MSVKLQPEQMISINNLIKKEIKIDLAKEITLNVKALLVNLNNSFNHEVARVSKEIFTQIVSEFKKDEITVELIGNVCLKTLTLSDEQMREHELQELQKMWLNNELI